MPAGLGWFVDQPVRAVILIDVEAFFEPVFYRQFEFIRAGFPCFAAPVDAAAKCRAIRVAIGFVKELLAMATGHRYVLCYMLDFVCCHSFGFLVSRGMRVTAPRL